MKLKLLLFAILSSFLLAAGFAKAAESFDVVVKSSSVIEIVNIDPGRACIVNIDPGRACIVNIDPGRSCIVEN